VKRIESLCKSALHEIYFQNLEIRFYMHKVSFLVIKTVKYKRGISAPREERESERSKIFQKSFGWRNAGAVECQLGVTKKGRLKLACFHMGRTSTSARDSAEKLEETGLAE